MKVRKCGKSLIHYILIYLLIISQGSIFFKQHQDWFYVGSLLAFVVFYIVKTRGVLKDRTYFVWIASIMLSLLLSFLVTRGSLGIPSILNITSRFLFVYIVYNFDEEWTCTRYVKAVVLLSEISLALFLIQLVNPDVIRSIFPKYVESNLVYYGTAFYTMAEIHAKRNVGVFAEPGLYQIVLSSAIYMILFMNEKIYEGRKRKVVDLIVLFVALITAQSTTGYMSGIILIGSFMISKHTKDRRTLKRMIIIAMALFLVLDIGRGTNGFLYETVYKKMFNQQTGSLDLTKNTGNARILSGIADLRIAADYPLGAGFDVYNKVWKDYLPRLISDVSSCMGLTKSLATVGFLTTILILCFYYHLMRGYSIMMKLSFILLFLNTSLGQPSIVYPALMILLLVRNDMEAKKLCQKQKVWVSAL